MNKIYRWVNNLTSRLKSQGLFQTLEYYFFVIIRSLIPEKFIVTIVKKMPITNVLVFECESDMQDNARALYEYLCDKKYNNQYRMVWVVKNLEYCRRHYNRKNVHFISRNSDDAFERIKFAYYISQAKYFFFTHPYWLKEWKNGQTVINLDHGAAPVKGKGNNPNIGQTFDFLIASSENVFQWKEMFWHCESEKLVALGGPRNDWLFEGDKRSSLFPLVNVDEKEKIIMVLPTYRQSSNWKDAEKVDTYCISVVESQHQLEQLNTFLADNHVHIVVKIHPLQELAFIKTDSYTNIHYLTNHDLFDKDIQLNQMIGCSDALITDFSSVYFDFLLLNRPIGFFLNDIEKYTRGLIMNDPFRYMPGEYIYTFADLLSFIYHIAQSKDDYNDRRKQVNDLINKYKDNKNSERLIQYFGL